MKVIYSWLVAIVLLSVAMAGAAQMKSAQMKSAQMKSAQANSTQAKSARIEDGQPTFVANQECKQCHAGAFSDWTGSHHDRAMEVASPDTVLGDFNDVSFEHDGEVTRFFRRGTAYMVEATDVDGSRRELPVRYTFGVEPLQQYLVDMGDGRLQALTVVWDTGQKSWYALNPEVDVKPGDAIHWTGVYQNWNTSCAECHSTNLKAGYDPSTGQHATTWSEPNVSCQACHGPGSAHVAWAAQQAPAGPAQVEPAKVEQAQADQAIGAASENSPEAAGAALMRNGLVVDFKGRESTYEVAQCARCHSRRFRVSGDDTHSDEFLDQFMPATLRADLYHPDGQIDDEVYVYGSFLQSKMYASGVRCTDCHNPHTLGLKATGNALCTRCHQESPDPRFPTLATRAYDSPEHHFHPPGSEGAQCVNCHMPGKNYMGVDYRRDHSFRIPRPDLSVRIGVPNACTTCHDDQTASWAVEEVSKRFPSREGSHHYGDVLAAARAGGQTAGDGLVRLAADKAQPAIVRATALEHLGAYGRLGGGALAAGLSDPDPLVRVGALRGIEALPDRVRVAGALQALSDPVRAVRVEAARLLAPFPAGDLPVEVRAAYDRAQREQLEALLGRADQPAGRLGLALRAEAEREPQTAEAEYRKALALDRHFSPARFNLVALLNRDRRNDEAKALLEEGTKLSPDEGEFHYSLGLLLAEQGDIEGAAGALQEAARLLPARARVQYNYGLALEQLQRPAEARKPLLKAAKLAPSDPEIVYAVALHFEAQRDWRRAADYASRLVRITNGSPQARKLLERYRALGEFGKP